MFFPFAMKPVLILLFYQLYYKEIFAEDRTQITNVETFIPHTSNQSHCVIVKYKLKEGHYLSRFLFQATKSNNLILLYKFEKFNYTDPGSSKFGDNTHPYRLDSKFKDSQDTVCFLEFSKEQVNSNFTVSVKSTHITQNFEVQNPELEFNLLTIIAEETSFNSVILEPHKPILYDKLCMKPQYFIQKGHYKNKLLFEVIHNDKTEVIYRYEKIPNLVVDEGLNPTSSWFNKFETPDKEMKTLCFKNITNNETSAQFIWKLVSRNLDQMDKNENFKDLPFNIKAVEVKEAGSYIHDFKADFSPIKPAIEKAFCNNIGYAVMPGYFNKEIMLQVVHNSAIVTLYRFLKNKESADGVRDFINQTYPWDVVLDAINSTGSKICFQRTLSEIFYLKYFWRVTIEKSNDDNDLRRTIFTFNLTEGAISQTTVAPEGKKAGFPVGGIIGIIIAVVVIIVIIIIIIIWKKQKAVKERRKNKKYDQANSTEEEKKPQELTELASNETDP